MEPKTRFELVTFSLPRKRSTPELRGLNQINMINALSRGSWHISLHTFQFPRGVSLTQPQHNRIAYFKTFLRTVFMMKS